MVLCYSRRLYLEFTLRESQEHFLSAHHNAWVFFGGVPQEVIVDNCKVAVLQHRRDEAPVFNPCYLDFARNYGFRPRACNPLSPHEKGRVEPAVGYVKAHFLGGRTLGSLDTINAEARLWMSSVANRRIHGDTGKTPDELFTQETLQPLNPNAYDVGTLHALRSSRTCRVRFDANTYSVPPPQNSTPRWVSSKRALLGQFYASADTWWARRGDGSTRWRRIWPRCPDRRRGKE